MRLEKSANISTTTRSAQTQARPAPRLKLPEKMVSVTYYASLMADEVFGVASEGELGGLS